MNLLPFLNSNQEICDGLIIKAFEFCKKNCTSRKCKRYHEEIVKERREGFYVCPYGLTSYLSESGGVLLLFTGFRVTGFFKKSIRFNDDIFSPILSPNQMVELIKKSDELSQMRDNLDWKLKLFQESNHEIKKLNSQIREHCDSLISTYVEKNDVYSLTPTEYNKLFNRIRTLYVISNLISFRNNLLDFENHPDSIGIGRKTNIDIYRKFDKYSKVLREYGNNISIRLSGSSYKRIMGYPSFEMIPFLVLENATKYTVSGKAIEVFFCETEKDLTITVSSFGPYCSEEDIEHIFDKGYRGTNAKEHANGSGLGLYYVKELCKVHNIDISAESGEPTKKNSTLYSDFRIKMVFNEVING